MSEPIKKTSPIVRFLGNKLGLTTREDLDIAIKSAGISSQNRPALRSSTLIGQAIPPDMKSEDYLKAYTGWVYSCVNVLALETANIDLTLYTRKSQNQFDVVDSHPVLDLLYKVNPLYTSYLLWEATAAYMKLVGESFWWLSGPVPNPREIWVLRPDWVTVRDTKGKLINNYEYGPPGTKKEVIPAEEIIHFKDFNPRNSYRGYGPVKGGAKTIDENNFQQDYNRSFFFNSALPGGALQTDANLTDDQYERIRSDWDSVHRGSDKAWKVAILEAGLKWQDVGITQREMNFVEGRKLTRDDVMAIFRVPKPLLTFDDINRAAAKEARAILLENVITHDMRRFVSFLNEFLLPRYGDENLFFDYKNPVPNDKDLTLRYYDNALRHGWLTRNEVREMENRDPIDGGDKLLIPFSLQDIGAEQTPEQKANQKKRLEMEFNVRTKPYSYFKFRMDQISNKLVSTCESLLLNMIKNRQQKSLPVQELSQIKIEEAVVISDDDPRERRWKMLVTRTDSREAKYKQILTDLFLKQKEDVNALVDQGLTKSIKKTGKRKSTTDDIERFVTQDDVFVEPLMSFIRSVIEAEGIQQIQSIIADGIFYMSTPEIQKFIKKDGAKFIKSINEETADQLRITLAEAIQNKESISQIKSRVTQVYEDAIGYRAERIARSEVARATNFSAEQAYIQSGVVEGKEWLTAHDERTCPWCGPMDGKKMGLKDAFYEKGDTVTGINDKGKKVYLTVGVADIQYPPLHPNCRCTLIPILKSNDSIKPAAAKMIKNAQIKSKTIQNRAEEAAAAIISEAEQKVIEKDKTIDDELEKLEEIKREKELETSRIVAEAKERVKRELKKIIKARKDFRNSLYDNNGQNNGTT